MHTDGPATDWPQALALYDQLLRHAPTPVVALNRAVAVAEVHGPALALATIENVDLPGYHLLPATRADLLARLGRNTEARTAYDDAIALATNQTERTFLHHRRPTPSRSGVPAPSTSVAWVSKGGRRGS